MITLTLVALLVVGVLALLARRDESRIAQQGALVRALDSRWIIVAIGVLSAAALWWCWGALRPVPVIHDEIAYVLQANIFAHFRWSAPSPPIPAFFEQAHVLVDPAVAAKYPPGHALVLALGVLVGWPALIPILLLGTAGALLFVLARRVANGAVALLTWVLWLGSPVVEGFGPSYFSETTTTVCWLAGWLALLEWRTTRRREWLVSLALIIGWGAITRPLTMLAYAIPVGIVVLRDVYLGRRWRDLAVATVAGIAVLALLPLWSARTTGTWRVSPLTLYTQQYMPWDVPGLGLKTTPPTRALTPDLMILAQVFKPLHETHTLAALPRNVQARLMVTGSRMGGLASGVLFPFALIGLFALGAATGFALASALLLGIAYLAYATSSGWTLYYLETVPVFAYMTASGIAAAAAMLARMPRVRLRSDVWRSPELGRVVAAGALLLAFPTMFALRHGRHVHVSELAYQSGFARMVAHLPQQPAVLFVRYAPYHNPHQSLVRNSADLAQQPVWVVYDRGAVENAKLLSQVPVRTAYLFDESSNMVFTYSSGPRDARPQPATR